MLTDVLRVVRWTDHPLLITSPSCSADQAPLRMRAMCLMCFCFGLWVYARHGFSSRDQRSMLFCRCSRCFGHVPRGQWALQEADMLVLIDRSACLVEPLHLWLAHEVLASYSTHGLPSRAPS